MATPLSDNPGYGSPSRNVPTLTHENDSAELGELLRRARERRGLSLQQISDETKIPRRHLEALEHDNLGALPGGFYGRAEIRAYARAVDLDQNLALAQFERALEASAPRKPVPEPPRAHAPVLSRTRAVIAIGVVVAAAVFGRAMGEREPAPDRSAQVRGVAESLQYHTAPARQSPRDTPEASHTVALTAVPAPPARQSPPDTLAATAPPRTPSDQAPPSSGASDGGLPATTQPAPARASAEAVTGLVVTTEPEGARVTVNGIGWGIAPVTIRYLPPGDKRIRVTKEGYATEELVVRLAEGHVRTVDIQLRSVR
jgi:cytoskeletal protein RodZ